MSDLQRVDAPNYAILQSLPPASQYWALLDGDNMAWNTAAVRSIQRYLTQAWRERQSAMAPEHSDS